jgi:DNA polymerase-1
MIKRAMIVVHRRLQSEGFAARMVLQVHDELLFEAPAGEVERLSAMVSEEMRCALELCVPVVVEVGAGADWLAAHG